MAVLAKNALPGALLGATDPLPLIVPQQGNLTTFTPAANTTYFMAFEIRARAQITSILWTQTSAGGASTNLNIAIYSITGTRITRQSLTGIDLSTPALPFGYGAGFTAAHDPGIYYLAWSRNNGTGAIVGVDLLNTALAHDGDSTTTALFLPTSIIQTQAAFDPGATATFAATPSTAIVPALTIRLAYE